jgi:hypothetical protein
MAGYLRYYPQGSGAPELLTFDVVESEDVSREADVTDHPVEQGAAVSDHVRQRPDVIRITADVSNAPAESPATTYLANAKPPKFELVDATSDARPGDDARTTLNEIHAAGEVVELFLGTEADGRLYPSMVLQSLGFHRDPKLGDKLRFTATFKEIRVVQSQVVAAPTTTIPRAQGTTNRGKQPTKPASEADAAKSGSVLYQWFGAGL